MKESIYNKLISGISSKLNIMKELGVPITNDLIGEKIDELADRGGGHLQPPRFPPYPSHYWSAAETFQRRQGIRPGPAGTLPRLEGKADEEPQQPKAVLLDDRCTNEDLVGLLKQRSS